MQAAACKRRGAPTDLRPAHGGHSSFRRREAIQLSYDTCVGIIAAFLSCGLEVIRCSKVRFIGLSFQPRNSFATDRRGSPPPQKKICRRTFFWLRRPRWASKPCPQPSGMASHGHRRHHIRIAIGAGDGYLLSTETLFTGTTRRGQKRRKRVERRDRIVARPLYVFSA